jgi:uncharacterized protein YbaP (TraB family)
MGIKKGKSTVYLYGSIHMVKKDMYPLGKTIEDAYNNSKNLALEVVYTEADMALMEKYRATRNYEGNDNVYNHLSSEGKKKLDDLAKEVNINMDTNKTLKLLILL